MDVLGGAIPSTIATETPSGVSIYQDDFASVGPFMTISEETDEGIAYFADYRDGEWAMWSDDDFGAMGIRSPVPGNQVADAAAEVDARVVAGDEGVYIAVACRYNLDTGDRYQLSIDPSLGTYRIHRSEGGTSTDLVPWTANDAVRRGEDWNHLRLDCTGETISAAINDVPVATRTDDRLVEGHFGLIAGRFGERSGAFETRFDNLEIRHTSGATTGWAERGAAQGEQPTDLSAASSLHECRQRWEAVPARHGARIAATGSSLSLSRPWAVPIRRPAMGMDQTKECGMARVHA